MTFQEFRMEHENIYAAKHGGNTIYIGNEKRVPSYWSIFFDGEFDSIDGAGTLTHAKEMGHLQFDKGDMCTMELHWHLVEGTQGDNTCPDCGNPEADDLGDSRRCLDCGRERIYTAYEKQMLREMSNQKERT